MDIFKGSLGSYFTLHHLKLRYKIQNHIQQNFSEVFVIRKTQCSLSNEIVAKLLVTKICKFYTKKLHNYATQLHLIFPNPKNKELQHKELISYP